jgi:plastocyanin
MTMPSLSQRFFGIAGVVVLLWCLGLAPSGFAATTNVTVGSPLDRFSPAVVTIAPGDQVVWTWAATFHSTTSGTNGLAGDDNGVPSGLWNSGTITTLPHTFTNTFPVAGNFSYFCQVHYSFGMTGAVIVAAANLPPTVAITNPVSGAVFAAPANVTIQAAVTNGSSAVTNVLFLVGSTVLTNETVAPFSAATNNLPAGNYTLSAIAADNNGLKNTNSTAISVVTPVTVLLSAPQGLPPANFQFSYTANVGLSYIVQRSTNLLSTNWTTLITNTAGSGSINFTDLDASFNPGFYRVGRLPNP